MANQKRVHITGKNPQHNSWNAILEKRMNQYLTKDKPADEYLTELVLNSALRGTDPALVQEIIHEAKSRYGVAPDDVQREYDKELVRRGFAVSRGKLKSYDIIDAREYLYGTKDARDIEIPHATISRLFRDASIDENLSHQLKELGWLCCVPCFSEGVLQVTSNRYIYWKIEEINQAEDYINIYLKDYIAYPETIWQPGVEGIFTVLKEPKPLTESEQEYFATAKNIFGFDTLTAATHIVDIATPSQLYDYAFKTNSFKADADRYLKESPKHIHFGKHKLFPEIFTDIDLNSMHWDKYRQTVFNSCTLAAAIIEPVISSNNDIPFDGFISLVTMFSTLISLINLKLYTEKTHTERKSSPRKVTTIASEEINTDTRLVRHIGNLNIKSTKVPKAPTEETIVRYKVPVWHARGGVRHYKDGKIVPFKDSIRRRKCLIDKNADKNFDVPQSLINVRKEADDDKPT